MSLEVNVETAFDVGVETGRKEMALLVLKLCDILPNDNRALKKLIESVLTSRTLTDEMKQLLLEASNNGQERTNNKRSEP